MTDVVLAKVAVDIEQLGPAVAAAVQRGKRFAGLVAWAERAGTAVRALIAAGDTIDVIEAVLPPGRERYPAVTSLVPAAFWYEREIHDLFGLTPVGHNRLDPLVLPVARRDISPAAPGRADGPDRVELDLSPLPGHVSGEGVFTIPYGPVRSGVFEAVEYVVETFGEDIPHLRVRPYPKHRGVARRFCGLSVDDGVLLAERVEGVASVAHATAFCQAIEGMAGVEPPIQAQLVRVVHAELERIANHLDSASRHTEGAGQAVAYARLTTHKERVLRLVARLCGHRFGRGVVVPGGVTGGLALTPAEVLGEVGRLETEVTADARLLMDTPSFLDRLRGTGIIPPEIARPHGALGPLGRGSGTGDDVRLTRPYGAYQVLGFEPPEERDDGDALARQRVRLDEIRGSWHLIRQALDELARAGPPPAWRARVPLADGSGLGWVEAPQGELLYLVALEGGHLQQVKPRTASFHNFALFARAFGGDIFTDFVFIEASFGASMAGVAG